MGLHSGHILSIISIFASKHDLPSTILSFTHDLSLPITHISHAFLHFPHPSHSTLSLPFIFASTKIGLSISTSYIFSSSFLRPISLFASLFISFILSLTSFSSFIVFTILDFQYTYYLFLLLSCLANDLLG